MTSQHFQVETGWQETPDERATSPRSLRRRDSRAPRYDATALAAALSLRVKPVPPGLARRVAGAWGAARVDGD